MKTEIIMPIQDFHWSMVKLIEKIGFQMEIDDWFLKSIKMKDTF